MFKRMSLVLGLVAALMFTTIVFAQTPVMRAAAATTTRIRFAPGTTEYNLTTYLTLGISQNYVLDVSAQQALFVLKNGDASVQVFGPFGDQLIASNTQPGPYMVNAAQSGDYTIVLSGQGDVTLTVAVPPFGLPAQVDSLAPSYRQRIRFAPGGISSAWTANLVQGYPAAFILGVSAQQSITISTRGRVTAALVDPQLNALTAAMPQPGQWQFTATQTGDYTLLLFGAGSVNVSITIPPFSNGGSPQRVYFAPGAASITLTPTLVAGTSQSYVLGVLAGQTLYISTQNISSVLVLDPQGAPISPAQMNGTLAYGLMQTGDYVVQVTGQGTGRVTIYIPPLFGY